MASIKYIRRTVSLNGGSVSDPTPEAFFNGEQHAHTFIILAVRDGEVFPLTGPVSATFLNPHDAAVSMSGSTIDGAAVVTLSDECYELDGWFTLTIDVDGATIYKCQSRVERRSTSTAYDPKGEISVAALSAEIAAMRAATAAANAAAADANAAADAATAKANTIGSTKVNKPITDPNGTAGQVLRTRGDGSTEWVNPALPSEAAMAEAINDWLDDHPEATTSVEDGSLTDAKFAPSLKLLAIKDYITPEMYGAKADGTTDDTQAIIDAFNACKTYGKYLVCPAKRYRTNEYCVLEYGTYEFDVFVYGRVDYIEFVGTPTKMSSIYIFVNKASTITFRNFKGISAFVAYAETLNVNANTTSGSAYNSFRGGYAQNLVVEGLISGAWVNENKFYDFRVISLSILGNGYANNNNRFYDTVVEGGTITLRSASSNYIQIRGEGGFTTDFSAQRDNIIERTYLSAKANIREPVYYGDFTFSTFMQSKYMSSIEAFRLDRTNMALYDERNIRIASWNNIATIYVRMGSMFSLIVNPGDTFRYTFRVLNSSFENITTNNENTCGAKASGAAYSEGSGNPYWGVSVNAENAVINAYDGDNTHWLAATFSTGNSSFIAPAFSIYIKSLRVPDYFLGATVLDS